MFRYTSVTSISMCLFLGKDKFNVIVRASYRYDDDDKLAYFQKNSNFPSLAYVHSVLIHQYVVCPSSLEVCTCKVVVYDSWYVSLSPSLFVINHKLSSEITHFRPLRAIYPHTHTHTHARTKKKRPSTTADRSCWHVCPNGYQQKNLVSDL
jgi:hypothetical protein